MDSTTKKVIEKFVSKISKKIDLKKAILFGSRAKSEHLENSDYDLMLVSKNFEGKRFPSRSVELLKYWNQSNDLEAICYTPAEFDKYKKEKFFVKNAIKNGKNIKISQ